MKIENINQYALALKAGVLGEGLQRIHEAEGVKWVRDFEDFLIVLQIFPKYAELILTATEADPLFYSARTDLVRLLKVLKVLPPAIAGGIVRMLGEDRIRAVIQNGIQLACVLEAVPGIAADIVSVVGEDRVRTLIENGNVLASIFRVNPAIAAEIVSIVGEDRIRTLIENGHHLASVFRAAPTIGADIIPMLGEDRIRELIQNQYDLASVFRAAPTIAADIVRIVGEDRIPTLIRNRTDLDAVLEAAPAIAPDIIRIVGAARIRMFIKDAGDLFCVFRAAPTIAADILRIIGEARMLNMIKYTDHLISALRGAPAIAPDILRIVGEDRIPMLIQDGYGLADVLEAAPAIAADIVSIVGEAKVCELIQDTRQLTNLLKVAPAIAPDIIRIVGEDRIRMLIKDGYHLFDVLRAAPAIAADMLRIVGEDRIRTLIENGNYLAAVFRVAPEIAGDIVRIVGEEKIHAFIQIEFQLSATIKAVPVMTNQLLSDPRLKRMAESFSLESLFQVIEAAPREIYKALFQDTDVTMPTQVDGWGVPLSSAGMAASGSSADVIPASFTKLFLTGEDIARALVVFAGAGIDARDYFKNHLYMIQSPEAVLDYLVVCAQFSLATLRLATEELTRAQPVLLLVRSRVREIARVVTEESSVTKLLVYAECLSFQVGVDDVDDYDEANFDKAIFYYRQAYTRGDESIQAYVRKQLVDLSLFAESLGFKTAATAFLEEMDLRGVFAEVPAFCHTEEFGPRSLFFREPSVLESMAAQRAEAIEEALSQKAHDERYGLVVYQKRV